PELVRSVMRELGLEPCQPRPWRFSLIEGDGREHGGLFIKREFKEIQANGSPERCEVAAEWPPVVGVENAPGLDVGDCALDWGAQAAHVRVELLLPFKQVP